ncbi:NINE protein [Phaeodactylibacter xiamenensis]|uniref:NINE protein n=1 Tax=Phaeodactylibacter xiamenensis TaxID=1524460 RepID=UPI0024A95E81|nr:NINE protein [Phaeodactylibacter xiamenensis]
MIFRHAYNSSGALVISGMKEKNVAGILALFLGGFGVHRFYLGQTGLGIFYMIFFWFPVMWIVGLIDAIAFFSMDNEKFDRKYNRELLYRREQERSYDYRDDEAMRRMERYERRRESRSERSYYRPKKHNTPKRQSAPSRAKKPANPYKSTGVQKFKDYDYSGAIADFKKALKIEPRDVATHFNIACAYSISEQPEEAFRHLDLAVQFGFNDFEKIREHDKLAYLRIQDEFEDFAKNGFRLPGNEAASAPSASSNKQGMPAEEEVEDHSHLLEQLKQLGELREKGLLTEEEFAIQKKRLLG